MKPNIGIVLLILFLNLGISVGKQSNSVNISKWFETTGHGASLAGSFPNIPTNFSPAPFPQQLSKADRLAKRAQEEIDKIDRISQVYNRFEGKHLFRNGKDATLNSFAELLKDNGKALRAYLQEVNLKIVKSGILPPDSSTQFKKWLEGSGSPLTIIDTDIKTLQTDVQKQFQNWWSKQALDINGKLSEASLKDLKNMYFTTEHPHTVTHITYVGKRDPITQEILSVSVNMEQLKTKVVLGTDEAGKPSHFEAMDGQQVVNTKTTVTEFSSLELRENAKIAAKFWNKLGATAKWTESAILNENHADYDSAKKAATKEFEVFVKAQASSSGTTPISAIPGGCSTSSGSGKRRKRALGATGGCAFHFGKNGEIDSIHPNEFLVEYNRASREDKAKLAEIARENPDKIKTSDTGGEAEAKKVQRIVDLEQKKTHLQAVVSVKRTDLTKIATIDTDATSSKRPGVVNDLETNVRRVLSKAKLSPSRVSKALNSAALSHITGGVNKVSNQLGKYFLAKTVIDGIIKGDTTSLAIVGGRVGYDVVTGTVQWGGKKFFSTASKVGKAAKIFGKLAGPVGAGIDVGLSVWSLTKSVDRLNGAKNKYDRNDAIADIVSDSVDIAVTASVTILSIAFPPAAPLIMAVGAVVDILNKLVTSIFKAANEVDRINSQIPLLESEKSYVFTSRFFDWFGTRQPDYLDNLLDEKAANDLIVGHNLKFLEQNQNFLGIVFPSRTLWYDGGCHLTKQYCAVQFIGCLKWEPEKTMGSGCDHGKPCGDEQIICNDYTQTVNNGYNVFKCICDKRAETSFGFPRSDSSVDFRQRQTIFWERSVPADVENGVFKCKPGNDHYIDYKVSQENSRNDYLCENAIGLLQSEDRRRDGQVMLIDLEDGTDKVHCSEHDSTPNIFRMGNGGQKYFYGGQGRNDFLFDSDCSSSLSGNFYGGTEIDGVTFGNTCASGSRITVDFVRGKVFSKNRNMEMNFENVEEVIGRENQAETVIAGCSTKKIITRGGTPEHLDEVRIPEMASCFPNITSLVSSYTKVVASVASGDIVLPIDSSWTGSIVDLQIYSMDKLKLNTVFLNTSSNQITDWSLKREEWGLLLKLTANTNVMDFKFRFTENANQTHIAFTESPNNSPYSILIVSKDQTESTAMFYHSLTSLNGSNTRIGCRAMENVFEISGPWWKAVGGDKSDQFIVRNTDNLEVDGGAGIDTLAFHKTFQTPFSVNLGSEQFTSIENIYGVPGVPLSVTTACNTMFVATQGGTATRPDQITVPELSCKRNTQIVVTGNTRVELEGESLSKWNKGGHTHVYVDATKTPAVNFKLQLNSLVQTYPGFLLSVITDHVNWLVKTPFRDELEIGVHIEMEGNSKEGTVEKIKLELPYFTNLSSAPFIQIGKPGYEPGFLVFGENDLKPKVIIALEDKEQGSVSLIDGFLNLENEIRMQASDYHWLALGGNLNDIFIVTTKNPNFRTAYPQYGQYFMNGLGGENTLILEPYHKQEVTEKFFVDLDKQTLGFSIAPDVPSVVKNIQHVIGREGRSDSIYTNCNTKLVNGRGGQGPNAESDEVIIQSQGCTHDIIVVVKNFTSVTTSALIGQFSYIVEDLLSSPMDIYPSAASSHVIRFLFFPWEIISAVDFDKNSNSLDLKLKGKSGNVERVQKFRMLGPANGSLYTNPVLSFQPQNSLVSADIQVTTDGVTLATFLVGDTNGLHYVQGIPVDLNRFLINITSDSNTYSQFSLRGCSVAGKCSANQFWISNLASPIYKVDGGACQKGGCVNYLHFGDAFKEDELYVNLNAIYGSVTTAKGKAIIYHLKNIHEYHGTGTEVVDIGCDTKQVSKVAKVIFTEESGCSHDTIIGIDKHTKVVFKQAESVSKENNASISFRSIHYRFSEPMSFDPEGEIVALLSHNHMYYLPFALADLESLHFDIEDGLLSYNLNGAVYKLQMISEPDFSQQFYPQPSMITNDEIQLQISRDGSIWATTSKDSFETYSVPKLQNVASRLGITIILQTRSNFYYVGHSNQTTADRNVLSNLVDRTSYLAGGGTNNTIYEIVDLQNDVFIHTGFTKDSVVDYNNTSKQTIDLTDVIVPLRLKLGRKYVPAVFQIENDLVIRMQGHENEYPGKIIIVDGVNRSVRDNIQMLLSSAIMDVTPNITNSSAIVRRQDKMSIDDQSDLSLWKIAPRPIEVPDDVDIYSISLEDLEDNQLIQLESSSNFLMIEISKGFQAVQNDSDLHLTNILGENTQKIKTILISDFFRDTWPNATNNINQVTNITNTFTSENSSMDQNITRLPIAFPYNQSMPTTLNSVKVQLPGLRLMLQESTIMYMNENGEHATAKPLQYYEALEKF